MNTISFHETATACGNTLRSSVTIAGEEFRLEMDLGKTWLNIIDAEGGCEACEIDEDEDVVSVSGQYVTAHWGPADWDALTAAVKGYSGDTGGKRRFRGMKSGSISPEKLLLNKKGDT